MDSQPLWFPITTYSYIKQLSVSKLNTYQHIMISRKNNPFDRPANRKLWDHTLRGTACPEPLCQAFLLLSAILQGSTGLPARPTVRNNGLGP